MKKLPKLVIYFRFYITLLLLFSLALVFFYFTAGRNIRNITDNLPLDFRKKAVNVPASRFNVWMGSWDEETALSSLEKNYSKLKSVSPLWLRISPNGKLEKITVKSEARLKSLSEGKLALTPVVTNDFDPKRVSQILGNSDIAASLRSELANLGNEEKYQGFDIDWEEINPKDQVLFTLFIKQLAEFLHSYNLTLALSVHAQTGETSDREVAKGYKLDELGKSADYLKIMAYDFHNKDSEPGAVTPLSELKKVLAYTVSVVPADKIILGLPVYGYDWETGKGGTAVTFEEASTKIKENSGIFSRDQNSQAMLGSYASEGSKHTLWFEDAKTIEKMIELARSYGVYQFSFWRIGAEDPQLWVNLP